MTISKKAEGRLKRPDKSKGLRDLIKEHDSPEISEVLFFIDT